MERVIILALLTTLLNANKLETNCLDCHVKNKLPTELIYKRYLMKYSTKNNMKNAIFKYLKNPETKNSIMPQQFFLKFNSKNTVNLDDKELLESIELFLDKYDIKKKLR